VPSAPTTLYRSAAGLVAQRGEDFFQLHDVGFDDVFDQPNPVAWIEDRLASGIAVSAPEHWLAPIESQEIWAAGVTYLRSRDARMDESHDAGGGSFYDRVYAADRPELFFKATPHRVIGPGGAVRIRADSKWNVPEPEVALAINRHGAIFGYTVGNDMSSRDIEGENPLYLPQAKVYRGCCALGPGLVVREPLPRDTKIQLEIVRRGSVVFSGHTALDRMKRTFPELAAWLLREDSFPQGCYLLTGTGIIPPNDFTLVAGDRIRIQITSLGTLVNVVA
jgi:2-dehydro-3-deoxy-D-arabinonate dehydratase